MDINKSVNHIIFIVDHSRSMRLKDAHAQCVDSPASRIEAVRRELRRFCLHQQASQLSDRDLYSIWIFDESPRCLVSCVDVGEATKLVETFKFSPKNGTFYREGELNSFKYFFFPRWDSHFSVHSRGCFSCFVCIFLSHNYRITIDIGISEPYLGIRAIIDSP